MFGCVDTAHIVAVVVELNCILINDDISVAKQVERNLMDDIRLFVSHRSSVRCDDYIDSEVSFRFVRTICSNRLGFAQTGGG